MKRLPLLLIVFSLIGLVFVSCEDEDNETKEIIKWRDQNNQWLSEQQARKNADGTPYYNMLVPKWDPSSFVLIHYFNERTTDPNALTPLYTSTVDVRYHLSLYNGVACDSSTNIDIYGPGVYRAQLTSLIDGWAVAVGNMNVGDTAEVIIPYALGYGTTTSNTIPAYSNLKFNIRLVDIYKYEASPETSTSTDE